MIKLMNIPSLPPAPGVRAPLALALLAVAVGSASLAHAAPEASQPAASALGHHDFDFLVGSWQVTHRRLQERLAGNQEWIEFTGTCVMHPLMDGWSNVDDNVLHLPTGTYRAVSLRSCDPQTGTWSIWWLDGRTPQANLDPSVKGRFENGVGTFLTRDTFAGKPILVASSGRRSPLRPRTGSRHSRPTTARPGK